MQDLEVEKAICDFVDNCDNETLASLYEHVFGELIEIYKNEAVRAIKDFASDCDGDSLAALYEHIFGGKMTTDGVVYTYYPSK